MRFGPVPPSEAEGAILAHSLSVGGQKLKKGRRLGPEEVAALTEARLPAVTVARLDPDDVPEDEAATRIGRAIAPDPAALGLTASAAFTGRLNLYAAEAGLLRVDAERVTALNGLDEAVTLATLPDRTRVSARQMVATVKIIPYAAPGGAVSDAERLASGTPLLSLARPRLATAALILTRTPGMKESLLTKGADAVRTRVAALGLALAEERTVAHETQAVAAAIAGSQADLVLILTASATSDRADVAPSALVAAGGRLTRFGMPVDPGNLLFLGTLGEGDGALPVVGLPGCARSPRLNGADWVLERIVCGEEVSGAEIAGMGVGGLLKEIPSRPAPRAGGAADTPRRPVVTALVLAAGSARRMRGRDKLLEPVGGEPLLRRLAATLAASGVDESVAVLRDADPERREALAGTNVRLVTNPRAAEGMGTSIAAGIAALDAGTDAVLLVLADMPELAAADIDRLIAAYDPEEGRAIVRATAADGRPGHPVLFGRRFFEALGALGGDRGAREVVREHPEFLVDVALGGDAAVTDLDTPEDWADWRARAGQALTG